MLKIGKRDLKEFTTRLLDPSSYSAISGFFEVHDHPIQAMRQEFFTLGDYPCTLEIKTPIGKQQIKLWSYSDFSTFNLVFCRKDYYAPDKFSVVVDIGSNIGTTTLYWLTRNPESFVYCYEPSPISLGRLTENLKNFGDRYEVTQAAVSNFNGQGELGIEESGVCSSLDLKSAKSVKVDVVHINDVLEKILSKHSHIDILKLDSEGHEQRTIEALDQSFYPRISVINVEECGIAKLIPPEYSCSLVGSAERFVRKS